MELDGEGPKIVRLLGSKRIIVRTEARSWGCAVSWSTQEVPAVVQVQKAPLCSPIQPFPMVLFFVLATFLSQVFADVTTGIPDAAPPGFEAFTSPIVLPAPPIRGTGDWGPATARARAFVSQLTLPEKVNITTGVDILGRCVGNTGTIPRLGWGGLCLEDSPLGVRFADFVSAFPAAINAAATWDKDLIYQRGAAMGKEHRGKGVNVALGPMTNMGGLVTFGDV